MKMLKNLFCYYEKVFIPMNTWITEKNLMKHHHQIKKDFYRELNRKGITDEDYAHAQKVWKVYEIKNLGEYHDLYVQNDTLLLADVFENFRDECIGKYQLDPAHFLLAPGLAWQACSKKTEVELELLTDNDMLTIAEKRIRGGMLKQTISI